MTENEKRAGYLKERHRLSQDKTTPHLPFALSRLEVFDFQGIKHLKIEHIPGNAQWIFLTGENGFGKTSILRALAKGLVGDEALVEWLPTESRIYINGYNGDKTFFHSAQSKKIPNADFPVAVYGAGRFRSLREPEKKLPKTLSLFSDEAQLMNIESILIASERAKSEGKDKKQVLTSPVFGFQKLFGRDATAQEIIPTNDYEEVDFIKTMKVRLQYLREQRLNKTK